MCGKLYTVSRIFGVLTLFYLTFTTFLQVADWHIIAVGIGNGINKETLREIAGQKGDVIVVQTFDLLITQLVEIKNKICSK